MVQTREEAVEFKARIEAGEDMGALADEYTLRTAGKGAYRAHSTSTPLNKPFIQN